MQLLLIKIRSIDASPEYALLGNKQEEDRFTPGDWKKVRSLTRGRRVLLAIPNDDVVLTSVKIPSKSKKQLLQAVPFALEDTLAEDVEDLHFAIQQNASKDKTQVAIINRKLLDNYLDLLRNNGITTHFVLPHVLIQTNKKDAWSILQNDSDKTDEDENSDDNNTIVNVRLSDFYGFSCNQALLEPFIQQVETDKPKYLLSNIPAEELPEELQDLPYESIDSTKVFYESASSALELSLQTGFVSKKKTSNVNWKAWQPTLAIASFLIATWVGIFGWQNTVLQKQRSQLGKSINNVFTSTFPKSRLVDPPQQMKSKLARLKKNAGSTVSSPLPLIADISPLLKEYKDLALSEIRYKDKKLELIIQAPNLTRLEKFKKDAVKKAGLHVVISSSTTTANKVNATLVISPLKVSIKQTYINQEKA